MDNPTPYIYINGDGNVIGDNNFVTITEQHFIGEYERLRDAYVDPSQVFDRVELDHFVGREWLLAEVDAFLRDHDRGYFVLEAEAGMGKSTFLAWLAKTRGYIQHFCELTPGVDGIEKGLKSLTAQLALAYHLTVGDVEGMLPTAARRPDYFYRVLSLAAKSRKSGEKIVLVIDALDVAGKPDKQQNTLALPKVLPSGVFIVASQRPISADLQVCGVETPREVVRFSSRLEADQADMKRYLEAAAAWPGVERALHAGHANPEWLVKTLLKKCCGEWIYLHLVIHEIEQGKRTVEQLDSLPNGVIQYYAAYWKCLQEEEGSAWDKTDLPVLAALAVASVAVPMARLLEWGKVSPKWNERIGKLLRRHWRPFISVNRQNGEDHFKFYHATLREFFAGEVKWDKLTSDEEEFIRELRQATITTLWRAMRTTSTPEEKRRYAMQLVRWNGLNDLGIYTADDLLGILGLAVRFVYARAERCYLIDRITAVLASPAMGCSRRQRAHLLVYQAGLHGNLGEMHAAASSYKKAEEITSEIVNSADAQPDDLAIDARIKQGRGIIAMAQVESLDDPSGMGYGETRLEEATGLLTAATDLAVRYGKDPILTATIQKELCWAYTLIPDWSRAEEAYEAALNTLKQAADRAASEGCRAKVLEQGGFIHWQQGKALGHSPSKALNEYQRALDLAEEQIKILEGASPSEYLVQAYLNWGEYRLTVDQSASHLIPQHLEEARERWQAAAVMARILGFPEREMAADQLLQQHCSGLISNVLPDA